MSKRYLFIGASAASMGAMHKLRQIDPEAEITVFSAEKEMPYNKCFLADYLAGIATTDRLQIYKPSTQVTLELDTKIEAIDPHAKTITSKKGNSYPYDALFLGTGSSPWMPSISGVNARGVFTFHTLADTLNIQSYIKENGCKTALICGAGLSGLEAADALKAQGLKVTVIEKNNQVLPSLLTKNAAVFLHDHMRSLGVNLLLESMVCAIESTSEKVRGAHLLDGSFIPADLVIIATGLQANSQLCAQAQIACGPQGVLVDAHMQTSQSSIYAGGDLIQVTDTLSGNRLRSCMWPDAMQQGMYAALAMAGQSKPYPGPAIIVSSAFFGLKFAYAGIVNSGQIREAQGGDYFHSICHTQGVLQGFQVLGKRHDLSLLKRLILTKQPLLDSLNSLFE